jgi:pyridoxal phosphate enzyme (YggS family)
MSQTAQRLQKVHQQIREAERRFGREPGSVQLLAVSKTHPADDIRAAMAAGQRRFGESYLQEAVEKIDLLVDEELEWHYIGRIQSNKTRPIAERFDWVHSLDKAKQAQRLNDQRPATMPPLNVCLQVKVDQEESKGGFTPDQALAMAKAFEELPRLRLRGLMTLPAPAIGFEAQRRPFRILRELLLQMNADGAGLDTLSMGMSGDLEAAIAEGATIVRVGTAIFGPRLQKKG